ncbi:hypothetical protein, partial [Ruminococcus sp.]|uniref:hypothetical protein n=1 Tax=Ruminococcus sp. TaxID=41978 RepID=UPI003AF0376C
VSHIDHLHDYYPVEDEDVLFHPQVTVSKSVRSFVFRDLVSRGKKRNLANCFLQELKNKFPQKKHL